MRFSSVFQKLSTLFQKVPTYLYFRIVICIPERISCILEYNNLVSELHFYQENKKYKYLFLKIDLNSFIYFIFINYLCFFTFFMSFYET